MKKEILKEGKISRLIPDEANAGMSGEVHLLEHQGKKYVVRKCRTKERADLFEEIIKKFKRDGFLPRLFCRCGNDLLLEYLPGRDFRGDECIKIR